MREKLVHLSIVAIFAALFYSNSFGNFFLWNDWTLVIENFLVRDWGNLPEIFTSAFWKPLIGEPSQIYRPLVSLSFMADFSLWRLQPWGYHLTNVSLHVANSILAYFLMLAYVSPSIALMGAILFAVHPIHTEAVTYISGRGELIMTFFLLSGTLLFLKSEKKQSWLLYLVSLPLFFLALLTKETAAIFPLLLLAAETTAFPSSWQGGRLRPLTRQIGPLIVLGAYYFLRNAFVGMMVSGHPFTAPDFVHHLLLTLKAVPLYLGLLLLPWSLHFLHPLSISSPLDLQMFLSILLLVGVGWWLRYASRSGNQAVAFALLWFLIGLLPLVYFIGRGAPLLEGWTYLSSLGFLLLVALGLDTIKRWTTPGAPLLLTIWIAVMLGGLTLYRNRDWKNDMQISLHSVAASPDDPVALRLLGNAHFRRGKIDKAEQLFQKAVLLRPQDPETQESLGQLYDFIRRDTEALARYQRMRELTPNGPYAYWRIGRYYLQHRNFVESERYFKQAQGFFPRSSEIYNNVANVYYLQGKLDPAEAELRAALRILPCSRILRDNLEQLLRRKG